MIMAAGQYNFTIEQGATFSRVITFKDSDGSPIDLTNYTAQLIAKEKTTGVEILNLTTENGGITIGGVAGTITLSMSAAETGDLNFDCGVYDLELIHASVVTRLLQGTVELSREVTT